MNFVAADGLTNRRWVLALAAIPLCMASLCLVLGSPFHLSPQIGWDSQGDCWLTQKSGNNWSWDYRHNQWSPQSSEPDFVFNVAEPDGYSLNNSPRMLIKALDKTITEGTATRWLARIPVANESSQAWREIEFSFPTWPDPFGSHYVIGRIKSSVNSKGISTEQWGVLDLLDAAQQIQPLPALGSQGVHDLGGTDHFVHIDDSATSPRLEVFELLPGGLTKRVRAWPVGTSSLELLGGTRVCTVSPDVSALETRDALTGELLDRRLLPAGLNRLAPSFEWGKGCLLEYTFDATGSSEILYDLQLGRAISTPRMKLRQWCQFSSEGLWLFIGETSEGSYAQVYDFYKHETVWEQALGPHAKGTFLTSSRISLADRRHHITTQVVDFRNGQIVAFSQPWWWVAPLMLLCGLAFAVWAALWVRSARPGSSWGWIDLLILVALPLGLLIARLLSGGDRVNVDRLIFAYIQGILVASCHLCGAWIVFGRSTRFPLRCIPLVLVVAALMCLLSFVFRSPKQQTLMTLVFHPMNWAWEGLATTLIPTLVSMLGWLGLTRMNFRLVHEEFIDRQDAQRIDQWPLRDFFLAITVMAVLVACLKPFLSHLPSRVPNIPFDFVAFVGIAIAAHVGSCVLVFSKRTLWLALGNTFFIVLVLAIIAIPAMDFAQHLRLGLSNFRARKIFLVSAVSLVWFYGGLLAVRYHYRLRWFDT